MSTFTPQDRTYFILSSFARSLSHKVRTPLSVLLSDLTYFESRLDGEDISRSKEKCRDISRLLSSADFLGASCLEKDQQFCLIELLRNSFPKSMKQEGLPSALLVNGRKALLAGVFESLACLIEGSSLSCRWENLRLSLLRSEKGRRVPDGVFELVFDGEVSFPSPSSVPKRFSSLTELYSGEWNLDYLQPPLIDSALWSQGFDISVTADGINATLLLRGRESNGSD